MLGLKLGAALAALWLFGCFIPGEGVDLVWYKDPGDGNYTEEDPDVFPNASLGYVKYHWQSPYIPLQEQFIAEWPQSVNNNPNLGRFPTTGDRALVINDVESQMGDHTVLIDEQDLRVKDMHIGNIGAQEVIIYRNDTAFTIGVIGSVRDCGNTIAFGPGLRQGLLGDNEFYLDARDVLGFSVGEGVADPDTYWVVAVQFNGEFIVDYNVEDHEDGTYTVVYRAPGVCGPASLFVGCNILSNPIQPDPFLINFFQCEPPEIIGMELSCNGVQLEIYFEFCTDRAETVLGVVGKFDCREVLEYEYGYFGREDEVFCYWRTCELLIVQFGNRAFVQPGENATFLGGKVKGAPPLDTPFLNETSFEITTCEEGPDPPRFMICGPENIPTCVETVRFDAHLTKGMGGREFIVDPIQGKRVNWVLVEPPDPYVESVLEDAYLDFELDVSQLQVGVEYFIEVNATNYQNVTDFYNHTFIVWDADIPEVIISGPHDMQMFRYSELHLLCEAHSVCDRDSLVDPLEYRWNVTVVGGQDRVNVTVLEANLLELEERLLEVPDPLLWIEKDSLLVGLTYEFTCNVGFDDFIASGDLSRVGSDSVRAEVLSAPLRICSQDGPVRRISQLDEFVMDASCTIDPDEGGEIQYRWCCKKNSFPNVGRECDNTNFPFGGFCSVTSSQQVRLSFNSPSRQFQVGEYIFNLTAIQGDRIETMEIVIELVEDPIPFIHVDPILAPFVSAHEPISLNAFVDSSDFNSEFDIAQMFWTIEPPFFSVTEDILDSPDGVNSTFLYLKPDVLLPGVEYYFQFFLRQAGFDLFSWASVTVLVQDVPSAGYCEVLPINGTEDVTVNYRFQCGEWENYYGSYYYDIFYQDPTTRADLAWPSVYASDLLCLEDILLPVRTEYAYIEIDNGPFSRTIVRVNLNDTVTEPETLDYLDILRAANNHQRHSGLRLAYNELYQLANYLLHEVNGLQQVEFVYNEEVYSRFCLGPNTDEEKEAFYQMRSLIYQLFTTFYTPEQNYKFFELVSFVSASTSSFCRIRKTQLLDLQLIQYLTDPEFKEGLNDVRITDSSGVFFQRFITDILLNFKDELTQFVPGECQRLGRRLFGLMEDVGRSYAVESVAHVNQKCVYWDQTFTCQLSDVLESQFLIPRLIMDFAGVRYELPDAVLTDLEIAGASTYDIILINSPYSPFECTFRDMATGYFTGLEILGNKGVIDFVVENLPVDILIDVPQTLSAGELQSSPLCKFWEVTEEDWSTIGVETGDEIYFNNFTGSDLPYVGVLNCSTDHLTAFSTLQEVNPTRPRDSESGVIDIWFIVTLSVCVAILIIIFILGPVAYKKVRDMQDDDFFYKAPVPPAATTVEMDTLGDDVYYDEEEFDDGEEYDWEEGEEGDW
eukprot:CAMPEP_0119120836 /NCGR_PEP_ID=MMETSP1310-20130426/1716_1 /TAXON_ID=464262 /ORGANISM="Genus nov. species nov., Strain RCC2339" /LENGTH=1384 /DNA_ID=CAMNT_0007110343 /DNA_START=31 /DNA_END=4182 /DNA_ORIENTATION=-